MNADWKPRVLMLSKACIVGIYQRKLEDIARLGVDLMVVVPPEWRDERGVQQLERVFTKGYRLEVLPIRLNGSFHLHTYRGLGDLIREFKPDIVHIDEEPYNAASWQAYRHAKRVRAKTVLFSWQNILRHYPPPFGWGERWLIRGCDALIVGTESAANVWMAKGYRGTPVVIPQFGTDPELFVPAPRPSRPYTIGYFGRLVEEKGVSFLLDAAAALNGEWRLIILGGGPLRSALESQAAQMNISHRVEFVEQVPSTQMPSMYHRIDTLVLPSLTRPNWKEQFGRVLVEAMSSGVPVIGSDSGAIPSVIADAGIVVPEGNTKALSHAIDLLRSDSGLYSDFAIRGRQRVGEHFTQQAVAGATVDLYHELFRTGNGAAPKEV